MPPASPFDPLITSPGRLQILTALVTTPDRTLDFVHLRRHTGLTDGNLATHTRRLESAGLVRIEKLFRDRKPVTQVHLTAPCHADLESHARQLLDALNATNATAAAAAAAAAELDEPAPFTEPADDWID
jgi:DNA-binding MarR family transcriptional regulator